MPRSVVEREGHRREAALILAGAQLLAVPTNNAWFGRGEMTYQQLAMSRLRAVEHGRAVVVSSTSGVSAIVQPDGTVTSSTRLYASDTLVEQVPLRSTMTPATRLGSIPEWVLTAVAVLAVAMTTRTTRTTRRRAFRPTPTARELGEDGETVVDRDRPPAAVGQPPAVRVRPGSGAGAVVPSRKQCAQVSPGSAEAMIGWSVSR